MDYLKYNILLSFIFCFLLTGVVFSKTGDVSIISSTDSKLQFTVRIISSDLISKNNPDSSITLYKTVSIGIPVNGSVSVNSAKGSGYINTEELTNYYDKKIIPNRTLVELSKPINIRGRQIVNLKIYPVSGDIIYTQVDIDLSFSHKLSKSLTTPEQDPYFDKILKSSIINYEQFKNWPATQRDLVKITSEESIKQFPLVNEWYKISVLQNGIYKINGSDLVEAGLDITNLTSNDIHIFNGGGLSLPADNSIDRPQLTEIAFSVEDGSDGIFGLEDYLIFYGESVDRRIFQADTFVNNAYTNENIYWLGVSSSIGTGLRMSSQDGTVTGVTDTVIETFTRYLHVEQDKMLRMFDKGEIFDYYRWYWSNENSLNLFVSTPNIKTDEPVNISVVGKVYGVSGVSGYFDLSVNNVSVSDKSCNISKCTFTSTALIDGLNEFALEMQGSSISAPYFDFIEIGYTSYLIPENEKLDITLGEYSGRAGLNITNNLSENPLILNITDPLSPSIVEGADITTNLISFDTDFSGTLFNRFYIGSSENALTPNAIESVMFNYLTINLSQADLIVIAPELFASSMDEYIEYRQNQGYKIQLVTVEDIMNNFSYGLYDPTAIRDFLKFTYENYPSPAPTYALFIGDGSYDYHDVMETGTPNFVPPFVHPYDIEQFYSDDNYLYFGNYGIIDSDTSYDTSGTGNRGFDMISARWPVKNVDEISIIIDKIKRYEQPENFGPWRSKITIIADDEFTGTGYLESIHTKQAEELDKEHIPSIFNRNKLYLWEYPFVNREKPGVNDDVVKAFNEGTLLVNYVGHGNPELWAHEHIFTRTDDLPRLTNYNYLPLVFTASCEIAFFDNPKSEGMAEDLLAMSGGAIGVISATRRVYSGPNAEFNRQVFDLLLYDKSLTICEAMYIAKLQRQYATYPPSREDNDQAYLLFGDPLLKLAIPQYDMEFTTFPDSMTALEVVNIVGQIIDENNQKVIRDGQLTISVFDSNRKKTHKVLDLNGDPRETIEYEVAGPSIYRGTASINSGTFDFSFVPPIDIGYGGEGAKISTYAVLGNNDAVGILDSVKVSSSFAGTTDSSGPAIEYSISDRESFVSGDLIYPGDKLMLEINDPSGINLSGSFGHGVSLEIDDNSETIINLTGLFAYDLDNFTSGKLEYNLDDLSPGNHTFKIKAWDNANNSSSIEFTAEVVSSEVFAIKDLLNYPNPMKDSTVFSFVLTQSTQQMTLEIYTLSGRKIKAITDYSRREPGYYDDIIWYGKDQDLYPVATGVYIFKVVAVPENGDSIVESLGKLVIIN